MQVGSPESVFPETRSRDQGQSDLQAANILFGVCMAFFSSIARDTPVTLLSVCVCACLFVCRCVTKGASRQPNPHHEVHQDLQPRKTVNRTPAL